MITKRTDSAEETAAMGQALGSILDKGDIICLTGSLGVGKTAFTGGIARALGIQEYITSPTFTLVNEYDGPLPLYHFDVYRIADPEEMFEIGFEEYLDGKGIIVVEWADLIRDILPPEFIRVDIRKDVEDPVKTRLITLEFIGARYHEKEKRFLAQIYN